MATTPASTVTSSKPCLRDLLLQFLEGKAPFYPVIETRVLQFNPLQITDDMSRYLDASSLQEAVLTRAETMGGGSGHGWKLVLNDWRFVFKKVPNAHEFYFDIQADNYKLAKDNTLQEIDEPLSKMADDEIVRWKFEYRKRKELEEIIKVGVRGTGHRVPGSPSKNKKDQVGSAKKGEDPRTPAKNAKSQQAESYILSGGKALVCPEILTIEELLDLPIPIFSKESIHKSLYAAGELPIGRDAYLGDRFGGDPYFRPKMRKEEEGLGKRGSKVLFDDVMKGLGKNLVTWSQFIFNHKTFEHLKERPFLLDDN
jgi:hypothetical protein